MKDEEEERLLPLATIEDVAERLKAFIGLNPYSKVVRRRVSKDLELNQIELPWGDPTLMLALPDELDDLADVLNDLYLPERLSALWHQSTKDIEVIWTAYELSESQKEIVGRKFTYTYKKKKYVCEFSDASESLLKLADCVYPRTNPSATNFRNIQSFHTFISKDEDFPLNQFVDKPLSFWIRNVRLSEPALGHLEKYPFVCADFLIQ